MSRGCGPRCILTTSARLPPTLASPVLLAMIGLGSLETLLALLRVDDTEDIGTADLEEVEVDLPVPDDPVSLTRFRARSWVLG
jgi:hypothetical protein